MAKSKLRLGRGLSSLLSVSESEPSGAASDRPATTPGGTAFVPPDGQLFHVELSRVKANPQQPRRHFDEAALRDLAVSLRQSGLIQPIVVRQVDGDYELVAGERRWRAAQMAGLTHLPALLRSIDATTQAELALVENIHRADLNPLERALAYRNLLDLLVTTQEALAQRLGEDRSMIANHLRLLDLCEPVRQHVAHGKLSLGHAKVLAGVHDVLRQQRLADQVVLEQMTVRKLEQVVRFEPAVNRVTPRAPSAHIPDLERRLSQDLQMRVQVRPTGKKGGGRVVLHYGSLNQFDELLARLGIRSTE